MIKSKWRNVLESGKTSSERESKIFRQVLRTKEHPSGDFCNETDVGMLEKRFLSGEERVFSSNEK
jgi:hypothetical protein